MEPEAVNRFWTTLRQDRRFVGNVEVDVFGKHPDQHGHDGFGVVVPRNFRKC